MKKELLLKSIAETGYNVGFGAKKHWATYDIVDKVPGLIAFGSMAYGIFALVIEGMSTKSVSAALLVFGLISLYVSFFDQKKEDYKISGENLTQLYNNLRDLYREVQAVDAPDQQHHSRLAQIESDYYQSCISKQILLSDWYAHYKFFWQHQIEWVNEQKNFKLFRDKIPLSGMIWFAILCTFLFSYFSEDLLKIFPS